MLRRKCILLLLTLLLGLARNSLGFAAWLKCNRRLEEDDFIMNNKVRKAQDDEPVRLAVYDESGSRVDVSSTDISGESIVWIDSSDASSSKSYQIRMDAASIEGLSDIQYVVETSPFDGIHSPGGGSKPKPAPESPSPAKKIPAVVFSSTVSPTPSSAFISASTGGGILCNGQRAHARGKASYVNYEYTTNKTQEIVAGWSEYHGRVTLTPKVTFKRKEDDTISQEQDEL